MLTSFVCAASLLFNGGLVAALAIGSIGGTGDLIFDTDSENVTGIIPGGNWTLESDETTVGLPPGWVRKTIEVPKTNLELILTLYTKTKPLSFVEINGPLDGALQFFKSKPKQQTLQDYHYNDPDAGVETYFWLKEDTPSERMITYGDAIKVIELAIRPWIKDRLQKRFNLYRFDFFLHIYGTPPFIADGGLMPVGVSSSVLLPAPTQVPTS